MPGNLKNMRAEPVGGTVNVDLARTTPPADPRFQPERRESEPDTAGTLAISGKSPDARIAVPHQKLPDLPPARGEMPFEATPRSRT